MPTKPLTIKKLSIIIMCIAVVIGVYYMLMIKPFDKVWEEGKAIYSGKLQPSANHPLRGRYRLAWGEPYRSATEVRLDIRRSLIWCFGNRGSMMVNYSQEYYDIDGKLLKKINGGEVWILEKIDGEWTIVDINVPNL